MKRSAPSSYKKTNLRYIPRKRKAEKLELLLRELAKSQRNPLSCEMTILRHILRRTTRPRSGTSLQHKSASYKSTLENSMRTLRKRLDNLNESQHLLPLAQARSAGNTPSRHAQPWPRSPSPNYLPPPRFTNAAPNESMRLQVHKGPLHGAG